MLSSHELSQIKSKNDVTILAHYYEPLEVQKIADYIGDSLGLAKIAKNKINTANVVFAGVHFMAETAAILNPTKSIYIPDPEAGCPLAATINPDIIQNYKEEYPKAPLIVYVNTTAATKAQADLCSTSSNAVKMIKKAAKKWKSDTILFGPDKNLAEYVRRQVSYDIITVPADGFCPTHEILTPSVLSNLHQQNPNACILVHPECQPSVQKMADYIGSTAGMLQFVKSHPDQSSFIIGTESGLVDHMRWKYPTKKIILAMDEMICQNMKKNTFDKTFQLIQKLDQKSEIIDQRVEVDPKVAEKAKIPIERMIKFS